MSILPSYIPARKTTHVGSFRGMQNHYDSYVHHGAECMEILDVIVDVSIQLHRRCLKCPAW